MTPGPSEPNGEQLQNYMKVIVDDLLMLYEEGIVISTPQFSNGKPDLILQYSPLILGFQGVVFVSSLSESYVITRPCAK
jgi:hypothetical protein